MHCSFPVNGVSNAVWEGTAVVTSRSVRVEGSGWVLFWAVGSRVQSEGLGFSLGFSIFGLRVEGLRAVEFIFRFSLKG